MRPKNFPARKLSRQLRARNEKLENHKEELEIARNVRTKKNKG